MAMDAFDIDVTDALTEQAGLMETRLVPTVSGAAPSTPAVTRAAPANADAADVTAMDELPKVNLSHAFREWAAVTDAMDEIQEKMTILAGRRSDILKSILESHGSGPFKFRGMELLIAKNKNGLGYCVRKMAKSPTVVE